MTRTRDTLVQGLFLGLLVLIAANSLLYAIQAANPLVASDGWHFVDSIVRKAAAGELSVGDLFAKRSALDHSQPLRKLILLFHYRYFDLDYSVEAIIGLLAAFMNLGVLWLVVRASTAAPYGGHAQRGGWLVYLGFCALAAVYLSLNADVIFNWPLLTLNYTSHLFVLLFLCAAWHGYRRADHARLALLFAAALAMDVIADDTGLITSIAATLAIALQCARDRAWRAGVKAVMAIVIAYVGYRLLVAWVTPAEASAAARTGLGLGNLLTGLLSHVGEVMDWVKVPLVASVAHRMQLRDLPGSDAVWVEVGIAIVLVAAHLWFWYRAWRGRSNLGAFVACGLMLVFYGLVAGMLLARVSLQGSAYLWQPRYVLIYEWNVVALLLMALSQVGSAPASLATKEASVVPGTLERRPFAGTFLAISAVFLLLLQVPLSQHTWKALKYVSAYQQRMALQMGEIAKDPAHAPEKCAPMLVICRYTAAHRRDTIAFLRANRLNVFSPSFRSRHRLYQDRDALPH